MKIIKAGLYLHSPIRLHGVLLSYSPETTLPLPLSLKYEHTSHISGKRVIIVSQRLCWFCGFKELAGGDQAVGARYPDPIAGCQIHWC